MRWKRSDLFLGPVGFQSDGEAVLLVHAEEVLGGAHALTGGATPVAEGARVGATAVRLQERELIGEMTVAVDERYGRGEER
jgi:hypothetical protein